MNPKIFTTTLLCVLVSVLHAQTKSDTIVVELAKSSKVILTVGDRADLETLKHYNFQELFQDAIKKLEANDTTPLPGTIVTDSVSIAQEGQTDEEDWNNADTGNHSNDNSDDNNRDHNDNWSVHRRGWGRTSQSFNFDLGTNNYLTGSGKFPNSNNELYAVRPWGSWYVGLASIQRTRLGRKFFLEWGGGINWYNFKFEDDNILIQKNDDGVTFLQDTRDFQFIKSKLTASYVTASLVPVIDFSDNSRKARIWEGYGSSFRFGLGPYVGYRIGSHSKIVYKDGGHREKEKERDSFYLNNLRYGLRAQIGFRSTDFFFNYDLNEMFTSGKGPDLNAFSFGVIF